MIYPKISVVSPSYNQGKYIEDAILSVLNQHYPNFEHIIVDGGSTDNTVEILKKYPHLRWVSEKDRGQSDALNKGFRMTNGDIICWLNTDDIYLSGTFFDVAKNFSNLALDALYGNIKFIDKSGKITGTYIPHSPNKFISLFNCYIPSTAFFFRRTILDNNIFIDVDYNQTMDKEFFANILHKGFKLKHVNIFYASFRWHENNKSLNTQKTRLEVAREGLTLFNRYNSFKVPVNKYTVRMYRNVALTIVALKKLWYKFV